MEVAARCTSAEDVAERWRHDLASAFGQLAPEAHDHKARSSSLGHGLAGRMAAARLGRAGVFSVEGTPQVVRRTRRAIAAAPQDPFKICIQVTGMAVIHQGEREVVLAPGQLALYDTGRPYDLRLSGDWTCTVLTVPRDAFTATDAAVAVAMRHAFPTTSGPGGLLASLTDYALSSLAGHAGPDVRGREHLGEAGIELVASMLESVPVDDPTAGQTREAVMAYVRAHLRDPDLCHTSVAAAHHMSPRSLSRLFEDGSPTVTEAIRSMRLDAVWAELHDPRWGRSPIMLLASRWGFRDQAHFTRAFKAQFGTTPGATRRSAPSG